MSTNEIKNQKKREFSLEKIATAIHCQNMISSLRNKYIDPLIIRHRSLLPKIKSKKLKLNQNEDPFSLNKMLFHKFIDQKTENEEDKAIQTKNNIFNKNLPLIPNKNQKQNSLNNCSKNVDSLLITSGMFKQKEHCKSPIQKVKLGNIIDLRTNEEGVINELYPKIENINNINDKYNLQLDLKHLSNSKSFKKPKKWGKKALKNYIFIKYATSSPNGINIDNLNNIKNTNKNKKKKSHRKDRKDSTISKKNTVSNLDSEYETIDNFKKDIYNEDKNTFITKLTIDNDENAKTLKNDDISKKKKSLEIKKNYLYEKNKNIINYDQKIAIDCLYSNVNANIEPNKLIYKSIDKTTFELQKEPSYKRIKKFESIIDKVIQTQNI